MPSNYRTKPKGGSKDRSNAPVSAKFAKQAAYATGADYDDESEWVPLTPAPSHVETEYRPPKSKKARRLEKRKASNSTSSSGDSNLVTLGCVSDLVGTIYDVLNTLSDMGIGYEEDPRYV